MRVLWAPWRMTYVKNASQATGMQCIFCEALRLPEEESFVIYRDRLAFAMLNKYPYNTAHVMVAPVRHVPRLELLTDDEMLAVSRVLRLIIRAIDMEYSPHGYNIGANVGRVAGAGIESHLHIHVVPRWFGDTNFMPVISEVKVMPESLKNTFTRLKHAVNKVLSTGLKE